MPRQIRVNSSRTKTISVKLTFKTILRFYAMLAISSSMLTHFLKNLNKTPIRYQYSGHTLEYAHNNNKTSETSE